MRHRITCLALIMMLEIIGCARSNAASGVFDAEDRLLRSIGEEIGMQFPEGTLVQEYSRRRHWNNPLFLAKVSLPTQSSSKFRADVLSKERHRVSYGPAVTEATSWWRPGNPLVDKLYLTGEQVVHIIVTEENERVVALILCFTL